MNKCVAEKKGGGGGVNPFLYLRIKAKIGTYRRNELLFVIRPQHAGFYV
jgi:hypothetical protein